MFRRKVALYLLVAACALAIVDTWRLYGARALTESGAVQLTPSKRAAEVIAKAERAARCVPEWHRPFRLAGLAAYAAAPSAAHEAQPWLEMASGFLVASLQRMPIDALTWRTLVVTAARLGEFEAAQRLAQGALASAPAEPANLWLVARLAPGGSSAQQAAYRKLTMIDARWVIRTLHDIADSAPTLEQQASFIAPRGPAYLAWAEAQTRPAMRRRIAEMGLALHDLDAQSRGWLHYYAGLDVSDTTTSLVQLQRAARLLPDEQAVQRNFGFALLKAGRTQEAKHAFERSLALNGDIANLATLGLAQAQEALSNHDEAARLYERLSLNPRVETWVREAALSGLYRIRSRYKPF